MAILNEATRAEERFRAIEQSLRALQDKEAILRTLYQYAHAFDYGKDPREFTDCFTDDAVWYSTIEGKWAGTSGVRKAGRKDLAEWFLRSAGNRGLPGYNYKHMLVEPDVEVDGDRATARSYFFTLRETAEGPLLYSFGQYLDALVRSSDGRWRIAERHLKRESVDKSGHGRPAGSTNDTPADPFYR